MLACFFVVPSISGQHSESLRQRKKKTPQDKMSLRRREAVCTSEEALERNREGTKELRRRRRVAERNLN